MPPALGSYKEPLPSISVAELKRVNIMRKGSTEWVPFSMKTLLEIQDFNNLIYFLEEIPFKIASLLSIHKGGLQDAKTSILRRVWEAI